MSAGSLKYRAAMAREWKDGEVEYCAGLLRTRGNSDVPAESIASYLEVQRAGASRSIAYARLHGTADALATAEAAAAELDTLALEWSRLEREGRAA